jgi:hypothetical protein
MKTSFTACYSKERKPSLGGGGVNFLMVLKLQYVNLKQVVMTALKLLLQYCTVQKKYKSTQHISTGITTQLKQLLIKIMFGPVSTEEEARSIKSMPYHPIYNPF